nr:hypothetical protein [Tanacetum cinerariifolium]
MANLTLADTHNMVAFLSKSDASTGFDQIVDFLNAHVIQYALMVNPTIYVSCIKQLWATVSIKKANDMVKLRALVDGKMVVVTKNVIQQDLSLDDTDGIECLPNEEIFTELARMGYEKPPPKLMFYKAFFSTQWKLLIHNLIQCISAKRTAWNKFSCLIASAIICLATCKKFNFSKSSKKKMVSSLVRISIKMTGSTPIETQKPLIKDEVAVDVNISGHFKGISPLSSKENLKYSLNVVGLKLQEVYLDLMLYCWNKGSLGVGLTITQQMVISSPCLIYIKNWLVQKQTDFSKDFSNPFMADNLPKIIWYSTHHASQSRVG